MSKYIGLFTFDIDNHRYVPIAQAEGIIDNTNCESAEPLIKDEKIRKAVRAWAEALGQREQFLCIKNGARLEVSNGSPRLLYISFWADKPTLDSIDDRTYYTIAELCGEEEE